MYIKKRTTYLLFITNIIFISPYIVSSSLAEEVKKTDSSVERLPDLTVSGDTNTPYQVDSSTAGTRFTVELERVPQSIQVIDKSLIEDKGIIDLSRLLRNVPSANVGASRVFANGVFGNSLNIRGFSAGVTRNGFRHLYFEDVDPSAFSNIERVEILKGPGSAVFGQEGLGGTINYVTKLPQNEFHAKFKGTYGEHDTASGAWDITGPIIKDKLSARFTGEIERSDTFVDFQEIDRNNIAGSLAWDEGGAFRAYINTEYQERDSFVHPGLPIFGTVLSNGVSKVRQNAFLGEPQEEYLDYDGTIVQTWAEYDFNENWTIKPKFQYFEWNGLQNMTRLRGPVAGQPLNIVKRQGRFDFHEHDNEYSGQLELLGKFNTGKIKHQTVFGLEYSVYNDVGWWWNYNNVPNVDSLNPAYLGRANDVSNTKLMFKNDLKTFAFYFQDMVSVTDRFDLLGSVRYEDLDIKNNFCVGPCATDDVSQEFSSVTFQVGGSYRLYGPFSLFAGYGTGTDVDSVLGSFSQNGDTFEPEESAQVEVGVKIKSDMGLQGTIAYFHNTHSNISTVDPSDANFSIQAGEQVAEGAEVELSWQINENIFIQAGYAFIDGETTKSNDSDIKVGNRLKDVAEHQANLWARYLFTDGILKGFSVSSGFNYVGERAGNLQGFTLDASGNQVEFTLPSYVTWDVSTSYQWNNVKLELIAQNILDKEYYSAGNSFVVHPGDARQVLGRIGIEF